ncbi:MAG TPA: response regulator [Tepidisphaeraceae bacterium]|nr:response regulator [Tepidisphaeraceae bacterium]
MSIRILDVGQCGFDGPRMEKLWKTELGATVDRVDSADEAAQKLAGGKYDVVLVNRLLAADGSSGLKVIERVRGEAPDVPVMLVSDRDDAQEQAVALGAVRGFGKAELEDEATVQLVQEVAAKGGGAS